MSDKAKIDELERENMFLRRELYKKKQPCGHNMRGNHSYYQLDISNDLDVRNVVDMSKLFNKVEKGVKKIQLNEDYLHLSHSNVCIICKDRMDKEYFDRRFLFEDYMGLLGMRGVLRYLFKCNKAVSLNGAKLV